MEVNLEAEYSLLGSILKKGELLKELTIQEKHFYDRRHQLLFRTLRAIEQKNEPIDIVSVITHLNQGELQTIGGKKYLSMLMNSVASLESFKTHEKYIIESWKIREANRIKSQPITEFSDVVQVYSELQQLELENKENKYNHQKSLMNLYEKVINQKKGLSGIDTGFRDLNAYLNGFQNGDLIISAARPSVGKTAKALNHAKAHCHNGGLTAIFSLEMGEEQLNMRLISAIGGIDGAKMRNPNEYFNQDDWERFNTAFGILSNYNLHIFDKAGQTVNDIRASVRELKMKYPDIPMLVIIDYLQLMNGVGRFDSRNQEIGSITRALKILAREENVPVYLLSQLSRGVEQRQNKRPMLSDLRDSGSIEQDADVIEFLYREDYYDKESDKKTIEVIIAKQRNGPVGTVELAYLKEFNLFKDLEYRNDIT